MIKIPFTGVATAVVTPMKDGKIDFEAFSRIIEMQIAGGADAVVVCGTTGESPTLTEKEKLSLFESAVAESAGRIKVIAGCGSPSTSFTVELTKKAARLGADAVLTVTPYYNKCSAEGLYLHYKAVAEAAEVPVIAYNVPPRTGMDIPMEAYEKMAEIENLVGIKEASGSVTKTEQIISRFGDRFALYSGCDELIAPLYAGGAVGVVSVVSNILPEETALLCSYLAQGKLREASALQIKLYPLIRALFSDVSPIPVKYALSKMGICRNELRLPLSPAGEKTMSLVDERL